MARKYPANPEPTPHPADVKVPSDSAVSQATAIEQQRAAEEVRAAVIVAQSVPRNIDRALAEMRDSCARLSLAERAFYAVPNRGRGPSVHLARELARIWGNIDYSVKELRRDDELGQSEVMATAWDQQTNVRATRTFIVPHARMKGGKREKLVDLGDVYLNNQNVGARAVRECIFSVLPPWFVEEAQEICRHTLEEGEGKPLDQRKAELIQAFAHLGVSLERLEAKVGLKKGQWTAENVADLTVIGRSIKREGVPIDELIPPLPGQGKVTAAEILEAGAAPPEAGSTTSDEDAADALFVAEAKGEK